ncbi:cbb3-type cytochrome oxidase assembly protein CcoS [Poriferisphaera sp. WC338]|uniref:cbb3-type cytochrome oxidase assembly protein CcoS n=1 Tax=Poriferisphaera sp. WC338 TaxID=3425129 RepID=UPI003D81B02E
MSVIYIILPLALILAAIALAAFIWAVKGGQFDDIDTPSIRMLHDDQQLSTPTKPESNQQDSQNPPQS